MFVRAEKRSWSVYGKALSTGDSAEVTEDQLPPIQYLIDSGELSLHERDPRPKKLAAPKPEPKKPEPVAVKVEAKEEPPEPAPEKAPVKKTRRRRTKKES